MMQAERLALARESISEAKFLLGEGIGNKVVFPKLYHALMYCLFALFDIRIIGNFTHGDIIERFEREFIRTGALDSGLLRVIRRAYDLTHDCDCDHMPVPTVRDIEAAMKAAELLLAETEKITEETTRPGESVTGAGKWEPAH